MERGWTEARPLAASGTNDLRVVMFVLFFCSGFCSLLYQVVWVRLAFSHFGVITPVLSCVLSAFMLGLGIGSLAGGAGARWWQQNLGRSVAFLYAAIEAVIGLGAFMVPWIFEAGDYYLLRSGDIASSSRYLVASGLLIFVAILPWCTMMGATLPVMMAFIRNLEPGAEKSFSFLYLANVMDHDRHRQP